MGERTAEKAGRKILLDRTGGGLLSSKKEKGVAGADSRGTARHHGLQARAVSARLLPSILLRRGLAFFVPAGMPDRRNLS